MLKLTSSHTPYLPFFARLVATLAKYAPAMATTLGDLLLADFQRLCTENRSKHRLDLKIKVVRFLAELVKFRVISPSVIFNLWKRLIMSPTQHNIYCLACLLEHCGMSPYPFPLFVRLFCMDALLALHHPLNARFIPTSCRHLVTDSLSQFLPCLIQFFAFNQ